MKKHYQMPRKKVRPKRIRKKHLTLNAVLKTFNEMEDSITLSILELDSGDDESCSVSVDSLPFIQNLSEIGECGDVLNSYEEKKTDFKNPPEKHSRNSKSKITNDDGDCKLVPDNSYILDDTDFVFKNTELATTADESLDFERVSHSTAVDCKTPPGNMKRENISNITLLTGEDVGGKILDASEFGSISEFFDSKAVHVNSERGKLENLGVSVDAVSGENSDKATLDTSLECKDVETSAINWRSVESVVVNNSVTTHHVSGNDSDTPDNDVTPEKKLVHSKKSELQGTQNEPEILTRFCISENSQAVNSASNKKIKINVENFTPCTPTETECRNFSENFNSSPIDDSVLKSSELSFNADDSKNRKRKRQSTRPKISNLSDYNLDSSLYYTPTEHSDFFDGKFYSDLSEIFKTPLSSRNSLSPPLGFYCFDQSSSVPCCTPFMHNLNNFCASDSVLLNRSTHPLRSCSYSSSFLRENAITPFPLSSNSSKDNFSTFNVLNGSLPDKENLHSTKRRSKSRRKQKRNSLKRSTREAHNLHSQVESSSFLDNLSFEDSSLLNDTSSQDLFSSTSSKIGPFSSTQFNGSLSSFIESVAGKELASDIPDAAVSSPQLPLSNVQRNGCSDEAQPLTVSPGKELTRNSLTIAPTFNNLDRLNFGSCSQKRGVSNRPESPAHAFSLPPAHSSLSFHQVIEACKHIAGEILSRPHSPPKWPIYYPFSRVIDLLSWIVKSTAKSVWSLRTKVSRYNEMEPNAHKSQECCSCQCLGSIMPKLMSKIESLDSDIKQIKSLLVQKQPLTTFSALPVPPPPPPPPPPPLPSLMTPLTHNSKQNAKKGDCQNKDEMTRPPITVEDLRRVTLRKTPLPQNKERKISTDPRCPVVSLEMLRSVKLRPRRRIIDSGGGYSIRSFLAKSSRERSDIVDRILNADSDFEENPPKKSRTDIPIKIEPISEQN